MKFKGVLEVRVFVGDLGIFGSDRLSLLEVNEGGNLWGFVSFCLENFVFFFLLGNELVVIIVREKVGLG